MIKHDIIITKVVPVASTHNSHISQVAYPKINSQEDLDNWIKATEFKVGRYACFGTYPLTASHAAQIKEIVGHITDYDQVERRGYIPYNPIIAVLQPLTFDQQGKRTAPYKDDIRSLRVLTDHEVETIVKPYLDRIQNHS